MSVPSLELGLPHAPPLPLASVSQWGMGESQFGLIVLVDFNAIYPGVPTGIFASFPGVAHFLSFEEICQYPRVPQGKVATWKHPWVRRTPGKKTPVVLDPRKRQKQLKLPVLEKKPSTLSTPCNTPARAELFCCRTQKSRIKVKGLDKLAAEFWYRQPRKGQKRAELLKSLFFFS